MSGIIEYVYCIVPGTLATDALPRGIDGHAVRRVAHSDIAALVSSVSAAEYSGDAPAERMGDPEWLAPRAVTHDAVVTWSADHAAVVPFPMWVLFSSEAAIVTMLADRHAEFRETLERVTGARELCVRVFADSTAIASAVEQLEPDLGLLESQASAASPGQAYLLRRKLAETRKHANRDAAARIAEQAHGTLSEHSRSSLARPTQRSDEPGLLLDGAYLVADDGYDGFRAALTELIAMYQPAGVRFDFTGPWPPYHFTRGN